MSKYLREWFKDPIFGLVFLFALIIVFSLFVAGLKDRQRQRVLRKQLEKARKQHADGQRTT